MNNYASFLTHHVTKEEDNISMFADKRQNFKEIQNCPLST